MGIIQRELRVRWAPVWWTSGTTEQRHKAIQILTQHNAQAITLTRDHLEFVFWVGALEPLSILDTRLLDIRREVEALGG